MMKDNIRKTRIYMVLLLAVLMMGFMGTGAQAANMISKAQKTTVSGGTWKDTSKGRRYKKSNGKYVKNQWVTVDGRVYRFDKKGYIKTGWFVENGTQYYASKKKGVAYSQSLTLKGVTYQFNKKGVVIKKTYSGNPVYLFVGDSRTVGMKMSVSASNTNFIGKVGATYYPLQSSLGAQVNQFIKKHKNVVVIFNFGVNDLGNISSYISWYRQFRYKWPRVSVYFMSVNPVIDGRSNAGISSFNKKLKSAFGIWYIDTYSYLKKNGFNTSDGLHYTVDTYKRIYSYTIKQIKARM